MVRGGNGYTIIETMIVLAVTVALFGSAMLAVSGKQNSVQFSQAVRSAQGKLSETVNQVSSGFYPSNNNFTCTVSGSSAPSIVGGSTEQGGSKDCVFFGKAIKFNTGASASTMNIFSLAARRVTPKGDQVKTLGEALVTAIAPTAATSTTPNVTDNSILEFGLSVTAVVVPSEPVPRKNYGTVLIMSSFPGAGNGALLASGSQQITYGVVNKSTLAQNTYQAALDINDINVAANVTVNPPQGIVICLADDPNVANASRKAMLTLGQGGSQSAVKLDIGSYNTSYCP